MRYQKVYDAVRTKTTMNRFGNDIAKGIWMILGHSIHGTLYQIDVEQFNRDMPCECKAVWEGLITARSYHQRNPNKTWYFSPKEVKFFGTRVSKDQLTINIPEIFRCSGMCRKRNAYEVAEAEVMTIIKEYDSGAEYNSRYLIEV